jgi:hypothetical protein
LLPDLFYRLKLSFCIISNFSFGQKRDQLQTIHFFRDASIFTPG